jgi:hypothetical protein
MKLISAVNRRLLKSITGGVLVGILCISGPSVSSGFPGPPWAVVAPPCAVVDPPWAVVVLDYLAPLHKVERLVHTSRPFAVAEGKGGLAEPGDTSGGWAVCITMRKMRMRRVTVKSLGKI